MESNILTGSGFDSARGGFFSVFVGAGWAGLAALPFPLSWAFINHFLISRCYNPKGGEKLNVT